MKLDYQICLTRDESLSSVILPTIKGESPCGDYFLEIELNSKEEIVGLGWKRREAKESLENLYFCGLEQWALGKRVDQSLNILPMLLESFFIHDKEFNQKLQEQELPVIPIAPKLFLDLLTKHMGLRSTESYEPLVCRCFNVEKISLEKYLKACPQAPLKDIQAQLKAGLGCGGCHPLISEMQASSKGHIKELLKTYKGEYPAEVVRRLMSWQREINSEEGFKVLSFDLGVVRVEGSETLFKEVERKCSTFYEGEITLLLESTS